MGRRNPDSGGVGGAGTDYLHLALLPVVGGGGGGGGGPGKQVAVAVVVVDIRAGRMGRQEWVEPQAALAESGGGAVPGYCLRRRSRWQWR